MKNKIIDFFKGFAIGVSNLIPGFSGGSAAVILNIYDRFVSMFDGLFSHFKQTIKDCWAILVGMVLGVIAGVVGINYIIGAFPVQTAFFISGLVIASYPSVISAIKRSGKVNIAGVVGFILFAAVIVILPLINNTADNEEFYFWVPIVLFFVGALCAAAMVVPGLSGALILMIFGYFFFIMRYIMNFFHGILTFNFEGFGKIILCLATFGVGIIIGLVVISKFLKKALVKWPSVVYMSIFGILIASPFAIFWLIYQNADYIQKIADANWLTYLLASIMFIFGIFLVFILPYLLNKKKEGNEKQEETKSEETSNC